MVPRFHLRSEFSVERGQSRSFRGPRQKRGPTREGSVSQVVVKQSEVLKQKLQEALLCKKYLQ